MNFVSMPWVSADYPGVSMILPDVDELLEILNNGFNPYLSDIQSSDLQVLVRNSDGSYSVTSGTLLDTSLDLLPAAPEILVLPETPVPLETADLPVVPTVVKIAPRAVPAVAETAPRAVPAAAEMPLRVVPAMVGTAPRAAPAAAETALRAVPAMAGTVPRGAGKIVLRTLFSLKYPRPIPPVEIWRRNKYQEKENCL